VRVAALVCSMLLLVGCGESGGSTNANSRTVYIEVGSGDSAFYMVSDNLDPSSWKDDTSSHKVSGLPNGATQVCKYTTSQGVNYAVWTTGSADSTELARAECQRRGQ
jgi:hypothetical protein